MLLPLVELLLEVGQRRVLVVDLDDLLLAPHVKAAVTVQQHDTGAGRFAFFGISTYAGTRRSGVV